MADVPRLLITDAYFLGAGVVSIGARNWYGERLKSVASGNEGTVAVGLLWKGFLQLNNDAIVVRQACHVMN